MWLARARKPLGMTGHTTVHVYEAVSNLSRSEKNWLDLQGDRARGKQAVFWGRQVGHHEPVILRKLPKRLFGYI